MRIARLTSWFLVACLIAGCEVPEPRQVLERQCVRVAAGEPSAIEIRAPAAGTLRIGVEPNGIALVARLVNGPGLSAPAISPVDRLGLITLISPVRGEGDLALRLESRDWPGIRGDVCVTAHLLPRAAVRRTRAERHLASGALATRAGDWHAAFDHYATAAREFSRLDLPDLAGAAYHAMAELAIMRLDRESDAATFAASALQIHGSRVSMAVRGTIEALEARAAAYTRDVAVTAELAATRALIDKARRSLAKAPEGAREAMRLTILEGFLAYRTDDSKRAERLFAQAMNDCGAAGDWECYGIAAQNTAVLAEAQDSFAVALDTYESALRRLDPRIAPELTADILDNMGRLQRVAGLVSESDASHTAALGLYVRLDDCDAVRRTLARIGALHAQVGSFDDALDELHRAASLSCKDLFASLGDRGDGPISAERLSSAVCASLPDPETLSMDGRSAVLHSLLALREAALLAGDVDTAARCIAPADSFAGNSRLRMRVANARGEILLERGDYHAARASFGEARSIADAAQLSPTYEHRGRAMLGQARASLLARDAPTAQRWALRALYAGSARADVRQSVESLRLLARGFIAAGQAQRASRTLAVAVELIESVPIDDLDGEMRATWLASQHAVFADLAELLAGNARSEDAIWSVFGVAERGRARSFKYALSQATRAAPSQSDERRARQKMLSRVSDLFQQSEDDIDDFIGRLDKLPDSTFDAFTSGERRALHRNLARLNAVLVYYAMGPRTVFAFVVDAKGIRMTQLGDREAIAAAAARLVELLRRREPAQAEIRDAARELARRMWWPISQYVEGERVLIAPDDALHFVPFAVLPWSEESADRLIVHQVETTTVPSALFVIRPRLSSSHTSGGLAFIADPVFRTADWQRRCATDASRAPLSTREEVSRAWTEWMPNLPASREEVLAIASRARTASGRNVETLLGCEATGAALRRAARGHALLHVATHGRIDVRRPRLSALALTPEANSPRDASFGLLDILDLDVDAKLVTLSACETSGGRLLPGEGVLGPAQAFLQAGAASVLASSRRVEDETTARFMRALYARLLDQNMSIGEALRLTQVAEQTSDTSYSWAAFALYGMPDTGI